MDEQKMTGFLDKAVKANSVDEIMEIANAEGLTEITRQEAQSLVEMNKTLTKESGELSDSDVENVAGGLRIGGALVVTGDFSCELYRCYRCGRDHKHEKQVDWIHDDCDEKFTNRFNCRSCKHCTKNDPTLMIAYCRVR